MKKMITLTSAVGLAAVLASSTASAGPTCTSEPQEKWKPPVEMLTVAMKEVTKLKLFKITDGKVIPPFLAVAKSGVKRSSPVSALV